MTFEMRFVVGKLVSGLKKNYINKIHSQFAKVRNIVSFAQFQCFVYQRIGLNIVTTNM